MNEIQMKLTGLSTIPSYADETPTRPGRTPEELRLACVYKLRIIHWDPKITAVTAWLVGAQGWIEPAIDELRVTPDDEVLARYAGKATCCDCIGVRNRLADSLRLAAFLGRLDPEESGYLLGRMMALEPAEPLPKELNFGIKFRVGAPKPGDPDYR